MDQSKDGLPATDFNLFAIRYLDTAADGSVYFYPNYYFGNRSQALFRVNPDGNLTSWTAPEVDGNVFYVDSFAVSPDGSILVSTVWQMPSMYTTWHRLYRMKVGGEAKLLNPDAPQSSNCSFDETRLSHFVCQFDALAVGPDGRWYIIGPGLVNTGDVFEVSADDRYVRHIAGRGSVYPSGDDSYDALDAALHLWGDLSIALAPDGKFFITEDAGLRILELEPHGNGSRFIDADSAYAVSDPAGGFTHKFDVQGRHLVTFDARTGETVRRFHYDTEGHLTQVDRLQGDPMTIDRPSAGEVVITAPHGEETHLFDSNADGWVDAIRYGTDAQATAHAGDPAFAEISLTMTSDGLLTGETDRAGIEHTFTYGTDGRLLTDERTRTVDGVATSATSTLVWDYDHRSASGTGPLDRAEQSVKFTSPAGRVSHHQATRTGTDDRERRTELPDGRSASATWFADGSIHQERADGTVVDATTAIHPGDGSRYVTEQQIWLPGLTAETSPTVVLGRRVTGGVTWLEGVDGETSRMTATTDLRNIGGTWNGSSFDGGLTTTTAYDPGDGTSPRTVTTTSPGGRVVTQTLDSLGRVQTIDLPGRLHPITYAYDSEGRVETVTVGDGVGGASDRVTSFGYDHDGVDRSVPHTVTRPDNQSITLSVDDLLRPTSIERPDGASTGFAFDGEGELVGLTPPHAAVTPPATLPEHTMSYGLHGVSTYSPPPDSASQAHAWRFAPDADGYPGTFTLGDGRTVTTTYDALHRPSGMTYSGGTLTFGYDATTGELSGVAMPSGEGVTSSPLARDTSSALYTTTTWSGAIAGEVRTVYDAYLRPTTLRLGAPGATETTTRSMTATLDADGLLTGYTASGVFSGLSAAVSYTRDAQDGLLESVTAGSLTTDVAIDGFGELTQRSTEWLEGSTSHGFEEAVLERDALGRIVRRSETIDGVLTVYLYTYDLAGRLETVHTDTDDDANPSDDVLAESYDYDPNGNRTSWTNGFGSGTVAAGGYDDQDRLLAYGDLSFAYNGHGQLETKTNTTTTEVTSYTYDEFGNLLEVDLPDTTEITYIVDGLGRRVGRKVDGVLDRGWLYLNALEPIAELGSDGSTITKVFVYGSLPHSPDFVVDVSSTGTPTRVLRVLHDHLGSVRRVVDVATGAVVQAYDYDAWGNPTLVAGTTTVQPFGFAGGLYDAVTGLVRFGARDYDPVVGRWTAKDPIRFDGGDSNLYAYALGDSANMLDLNGKDVELYCEYISGHGSPAGISRHCFVRAYQPWSGGYDVTLEIWGPPNENTNDPDYPFDIWGNRGRPKELPADQSRLDPCWHSSYPHQYRGIEDDAINAFREMSSDLPEYYYLGPNSNTFARDILQAVGITPNMPFNAPWSGSMFSGLAD